MLNEIKLNRLISNYLSKLVRLYAYQPENLYSFVELNTFVIIFTIDKKGYISEDYKFFHICQKLGLEYNDETHDIIVNTINSMYNAKGIGW